jgi:hypothetical protein
MPNHPHRFGCGEIATGFKSGGLPPGFFGFGRIIPKGGGSGRHPGGSCVGCGGGGNGNPWVCEEERFYCSDRYPNGEKECPPAHGGPAGDCIRTSKCVEVTKGSCEPGIGNCYADKDACDKVRAKKDEEGCKTFDHCVKGGGNKRYGCVVTPSRCTGPGGGTYYKKDCVENPTGPYETLVDCELECKDIDCPVVGGGPVTGGTAPPGLGADTWSCVETGDTIPCNLPGGTGSNITVAKVKCLPCKCTKKEGPDPAGYTCVPDGTPGGSDTKQCWTSIKGQCDFNCKPKECPRIYNKYDCYEESRELCNIPPATAEYKIIRQCQPCQCFIDPGTLSEKCFKQNINPTNGKPFGDFVNRAPCLLKTCIKAQNCPDKGCPPTPSAVPGGIFD